MDLKSMIDKYYDEHVVRVRQESERQAAEANQAYVEKINEFKLKFSELISTDLQTELGVTFHIDEKGYANAQFSYYGVKVVITVWNTCASLWQIKYPNYSHDALGADSLLKTLLIDLGKVKNNLKNFTVTVGILVFVKAPSLEAATNVAVSRIIDEGYEIDYETTFD